MSRCAKGHKRPKKSYGSTRGVYWCRACDKDLVQTEPNKKRARREGKKEIEKETKMTKLMFVVLILVGVLA